MIPIRWQLPNRYILSLNAITVNMIITESIFYFITDCDILKQKRRLEHAQ